MQGSEHNSCCYVAMLNRYIHGCRKNWQWRRSRNQDIGINTLQIQKSPDELRWGSCHQGILCILISFYSIYPFPFQIFLLSDAFACFAIAFQHPGAGDGLAGTVVEIYLLVALA